MGLSPTLLYYQMGKGDMDYKAIAKIKWVFAIMSIFMTLNKKIHTAVGKN